MPFLLYERIPGADGATEYMQLKDLSLAGTAHGLIYPFVTRYAPDADVFRWHGTGTGLSWVGTASSKAPGDSQSGFQPPCATEVQPSCSRRPEGEEVVHSVRGVGPDASGADCA